MSDQARKQHPMDPTWKLFCLLPLISLNFSLSSCLTDTIDSIRSVRDGETIVSSGGMFELGFFSPGKSKNRYVGIWYNRIQVKTIVWVANREIPLINQAGVLKVTEPGFLVLVNDSGGTVWSSNRSRSLQTPVAQLLDSGNLVVKDADDDDTEENYIWQSFDYPTDTYIPGMKFGWNLVTGVDRYLSSWKTDDDPAPGELTYHLELTGYPQIVLRRNSAKRTRMGPWNGINFSGFSNVRGDSTYTFNFVMDKNEVYYKEIAIDKLVVRRFTLKSSGVGQRLTWVNRTQMWEVYMNRPADNCDNYGLCGAYGICYIQNFPACSCLDRFAPKDSEGWNKADWTNGCIGSGCLLWFGDLVDIRWTAYGQDIYIRMASSEVGSRGIKRRILIVSLTSMMGMTLLALSLILFIRKRNKDSTNGEKGKYNESKRKEPELPFFKLATILKATNHFSIENKLGEGGFGPVYKGMLEGGQEIAVKRLSITSTQGLDEFKNEVIFIAKLQHRNLVRLLGCCTQRDENMLIYEFMPNKSLDVILFGEYHTLSYSE